MPFTVSLGCYAFEGILYIYNGADADEFMMTSSVETVNKVHVIKLLPKLDGQDVDKDKWSRNG
jgi:hypothetical protein